MVTVEANVTVDESFLSIQFSGGNRYGGVETLCESHVFGVGNPGRKHHGTISALKVVFHVAVRGGGNHLGETEDMYVAK